MSDLHAMRRAWVRDLVLRVRPDMTEERVDAALSEIDPDEGLSPPSRDAYVVLMAITDLAMTIRP